VEVRVIPAEPRVVRGEEIALEAVVHGANGEVLHGREVFWSVEDERVARVNSDGRLRGMAVGVTRVAASSGGRAGVAEVRVVPRPVGALVLTPDSLRIAVGAEASFSVRILDDLGEEIAGRAVQWSSAESAVATVDGQGLVRGVRPGVTQVTAAVDGVGASRPVRVVAGTPAGVQLVSGDDQRGTVGQPLPEPLHVRVVDAAGNPVPGVTVSWRVDSGDGSIDSHSGATNAAGEATAVWRLGIRPGRQNAAGVVTGLPPAEFTAVASPGSITTITVAPTATTFSAIDETRLFSASAFDLFGNPVSGASFSWVSLAPAVASVDGAGLARARANGSARIVVAAGNASDTATVTVNQVVDAVTVTPAELDLAGPGSTGQLSAVARDRNGHPVPGATIAWSSLNPGVATVSASGLVTAESLGTASIRASAAGRTGHALVTVAAVAPPGIRIVSGDRQTGRRGTVLAEPLVVEVRDAQGNPVAGALVTWAATQGGTLEPSATLTDAAGRASVQWRLGMPESTQHATATLQQHGTSVVFEATSVRD
jgi:uncharacterized protein YjdB